MAQRDNNLPLSEIKGFSRGGLIAAAKLNALVRAANVFLKIAAESGLSLPTGRDSFWAGLGDVAGTGFAFTEQSQDADGAWGANPNGRTGTADDIPADIVRVFPRFRNDGKTKEYWYQAQAGDRFGTPTVEYGASQTSIILTPSDVAGVATGEDNVTVRVQQDGTAFDPSEASIFGTDPTAVTCVVPVTTTIPFRRAASGVWYIPATPIQAIWDITLDGTDPEMFFKVYHNWGAFQSTVSDWTLAHTGTDC